jgi:hypothetical protein
VKRTLGHRDVLDGCKLHSQDGDKESISCAVSDTVSSRTIMSTSQSTSQSMAPNLGVRLLSIGKVDGVDLQYLNLTTLQSDGGGIRGLSALYILREIMYRIQQQRDLPELPLPCEYFDLAGGTGTGG